MDFMYSSGIRVIADNAGGLTLQLANTSNDTEYVFERYYNNPQTCADDIISWCNGSHASSWHDNEIDSENGILEPTGEQIRMGGYRELFGSSEFDINSSWRNIKELSEALYNYN